MSCAVLISPRGTLFWCVLIPSDFAHHKVFSYVAGLWDVLMERRSFTHPTAEDAPTTVFALLSYMQPGGDSH